MIPKVIHYCWFGGEELPPFVKRCIATWQKVLPDYKLRLWNESNFDFDSVPYVRDAYHAKKWAFVTDYVRLYALYNEGGVYMDTDVKVLKSFNPYLNYNLFTSHEVHPFFYEEKEQAKLNADKIPQNPEDFIEGFGVLSAIMGAVPELPFLKDCLEYYNGMTFDLVNKTKDDYIIGKHISRVMLRYGYRFADEDQLLQDNMLILNSSVFVGNILYLKKDSYAIHLCNGSWTDNADSFDRRLRNHYPRMYRIWSVGRRGVNWIKRRLK